jgi:hypothetical protein
MVVRIYINDDRLYVDLDRCEQRVQQSVLQSVALRFQNVVVVIVESDWVLTRHLGRLKLMVRAC